MIESNLEKELKIYDDLMRVPSNIKLRDMVIEHIDNSSWETMILPNIIDEGKPFAKQLLAKHFLDKVFDIAVQVYLYHSKPDKVIQFIVFELRRLDYKLQQLYRGLLIFILKDKNRLDVESTGLKYILERLENINLETEHTNYDPTIGEFTFFANSSSSDSIDIKPIIEAFIKVRGWAMNKKEQYQQYIKNNFSPELIEAFDCYYKTPIIQNSTVNKPAQKQIKPIQLDLEQRQIIYLFQKLIDESLLNENKNPTVWDLVAQYFTDKDGKTLNNIHQNKDGLKNTKTGKPKKKADVIENIVSNTKNLK